MFMRDDICKWRFFAIPHEPGTAEKRLSFCQLRVEPEDETFESQTILCAYCGTMERIEEVLRSEGVVFIDEDAEYHPAIRIRKEVFPYPIPIQDPGVRPFTIRSRISKTKPKKPRKKTV